MRFVVDSAHHGLRIDTFLSSRLRNYVPARIQRMAAGGLISVNDAPCPPDRRMARGEEVLVRLAEPPEPFYPPEPILLEVLYDDPWLVAVNKPAGLLVHPAGPIEGGTLANAAQALLDGQTVLPGLLRPGIVHRLDRETSGVMLIAKDSASHAGLTGEFERSAVEKSYVALVAGRIEEDETTIRHPIGQRPGSLLMSSETEALGPRPAETIIRVLRRFRTTTLVEARPRSGRKHQIRVHLAAIGHPVLGDVYYSTASGRREPVGHSASLPSDTRRHALHAAAIAFHHPITNAARRIVAPVPSDFWSALGDGCGK
ncbi:MAG: RluA family pseudouridine synthase [Planctomycetota bacterium]|nr:RluA family pseudouridine synthase [Planctomycetaceae bacterium]MDQ3330565.1 RluA family pseudouridine synthase [Planctomycetota bacterium]